MKSWRGFYHFNRTILVVSRTAVEMPVGPSSGRGRKSVDYSQKWGFMRGFMGHAIVILE